MSSKAYRPPNNDYVASDTDILDDLPQRRAREELIPIIAKKSRNAVNVTPIYIHYFQRLKTGRRCSCWGIEDSPSGSCRLCYNVGIVGAYNKRGTKTEVFDVTYPCTSAINISPDYGSPTRPIYWSLNTTSVYGTISFSIPITSNIGMLDTLEILDYQPSGTSIIYEVKTPQELTYTELTETSLEARLLNTSRLDFQITMTRATPNATVPKLIGIRIAYRTLKIASLRVDIPRVTESLTLEEFGIYESFTTQNFFLDNTLKNASTEDFLINLLDNTRWKITEVKDNKPLGILTSWDLTGRKIQEYEPYAKVNAGASDTTELPPNIIRSIQTDADLVANDRETTTIGDRKPGHRAKATVTDGAPVDPGIATPGEPLREV